MVILDAIALTNDAIQIAIKIYKLLLTARQNRREADRLCNLLRRLQERLRQFNDVPTETSAKVLSDIKEDVRSVFIQMSNIHTELSSRKGRWVKWLNASEVASDLRRVSDETLQIQTRLEQHAQYVDMIAYIKNEFIAILNQQKKSHLPPKVMSYMTTFLNAYPTTINLNSDKGESGDAPTALFGVLQELSRMDKAKRTSRIERLRKRLEALWDQWGINEKNIRYETEGKNGKNSVLGHGSCGTVFGAKYFCLGQYINVAVKEFHPGFEDIAMREALLHMRLRPHPCILHLHGVITQKQQQQPLLVCERMTCNVRDSIRKGLISDIHTKRRVLHDVCSALLFMHSRDLVHRDVKAENVLIRLDNSIMVGCAKLCDFGTARQLETAMTCMTTAQGTLPFLPPEVLKDVMKARSTYAWDVWAFGLLCCTVCAPGKVCLNSWEHAVRKNDLVKLEIYTMEWCSEIPDATIARAAKACLEPKEKKRPSIKTIQDILHDHYDEVVNNSSIQSMELKNRKQAQLSSTEEKLEHRRSRKEQKKQDNKVGNHVRFNPIVEEIQ